jgi:hypothetical protein
MERWPLSVFNRGKSWKCLNVQQQLFHHDTGIFKWHIWEAKLLILHCTVVTVIFFSPETNWYHLLKKLNCGRGKQEVKMWIFCSLKQPNDNSNTQISGDVKICILSHLSSLYSTLRFSWFRSRKLWSCYPTAAQMSINMFISGNMFHWLVN